MPKPRLRNRHAQLSPTMMDEDADSEPDMMSSEEEAQRPEKGNPFPQAFPAVQGGGKRGRTGSGGVGSGGGAVGRVTQPTRVERHGDEPDFEVVRVGGDTGWVDDGQLEDAGVVEPLPNERGANGGREGEEGVNIRRL